MRRLIDFYRLQIHVMRTWRPSTGSRLRRLLATMIVSVLSFGIAVFLTPGVDLTAGAGIFSTALLAAIVLGILNVAIRPVLIAAFAAVSVIAVTIATLVFQVVSFLILPRFVDTLVVSGWFAALVASLDLRDGDDGLRRHLLDQQRRLLLRHPGPAAVGSRTGRPSHRCPRPRRRPDRRSGAPDPDPPDPGRSRASSLGLGALRTLQPRRLGGAPATHDAGEPGWAPPWEQRRHPRLPLV